LFFVSGRRRHTRFSRDWSSDVCSSDLISGKLMTHWGTFKRLQLAGTMLMPPAISLIALADPAATLFMAAALSLVGFSIGLQLPRSEERRVGKACTSRRRPGHPACREPL